METTPAFYRREVGEVCRKRGGLFGGLFNNNMTHVFEGLEIWTIRRELHQITVEDREIYTGAKTILNICLDMMSSARVPTDVCASTSQLQTSSMTVTSHVLHWNNKQCSGDRLYWGGVGFHLLQSNKQPIQNARDQSRQTVFFLGSSSLLYC